ncbi:MAG: hypothetical protein H7122_11560 [Chitinophagaceae bacterium]|nr:hypothetical protein [Chitinophagaceae bacterium]
MPFKINNSRLSALPQKAFALTLFALLTIACPAQSLHYPIAAGYTGMGAYSKNFVDVLSINSNQAVLAALQSISVAVYTEKRFLLKELNLYHFAFCLPLQFGGFGISTKYFGYSEYNETELGLAYGKNLGKVDIGVQFSYHALRINGYGKDALFNIEVGAILHISEQLRAGLHTFNPTRSRLGKNNLEKLPSLYRVGMGYEASEKLFISAEILKEEDKPVNINAGLQYVFAKRISARLGLYTETTNFYFGVGLKWNVFRFDITGSYHPQLGMTPGLMIVFKKNVPEE